MRRYRWLLLAWTTLTLRGVPLAAGESPLTVQPVPVRQGEALAIRLNEPGAQQVRTRWRNRTYALYRQDGGWGALLPVPPETPAGSVGLVLTYTRHGEPRQLRTRVAVSKVDFPVQHLHMAAKTASLYTYPGVKREDAIVWGATQTHSAALLWRGDWMLPARGPLSTPFGVRRLRNGRAVGRHRGLDIEAAGGSPIVAPAAGKVVLTGGFKKHGNVVVLDHGQGVSSLYIHLSKIEVKRGQTVRRGEELGKVGSTGAATGPHLHWSVYAQGQPVNPLFFCRLTQRGVHLPPVSAK